MASILGISAFYHDSAAALVQSGRIVAAAQEERFSRKKHDPKFPKDAIEYCLETAGIGLSELDAVVFYDKPLIKFERLLETYLAYAPKGLSSFVTAMPVWLKEKLFLKSTLKKEMALFSGISTSKLPPLLFTDHHQSHAASAFFPSPFQEAAVLCMDGVGEWATTTLWLGEGNRLKPIWELQFPHSLGLLYSAFTYYCGFRVNSGEYKLMGLAPYGKPAFVETIFNELIDLKKDGSFKLDMTYFSFATGLRMTNAKFANLFGRPAREPESKIEPFFMDIAASIQAVTEEIVLRLGQSSFDELGVTHLCLAGGVALNCVANGRLLREGPFDGVWVQPAAGDAGGALGAALSYWHEYKGQSRVVVPGDAMSGGFLGPEFEVAEIKRQLKGLKATYRELPDDELLTEVAGLLAEGHVLGWFQGRMEFGPRALGARSILGDARNQAMQKVMNLKIKYRESFRPFAPAVKHDRVSDWFVHDGDSPYMLFVAPVASSRHTKDLAYQPETGLDLLNIKRSEIPAVTHVDFSARLQTVHPETNPRFYGLLDEFERQTGCPVLVNTSFNVRGEPIVRTPEDAYRCFMRTEMDFLVLENLILAKTEQPPWLGQDAWHEEFGLD